MNAQILTTLCLFHNPRVAGGILARVVRVQVNKAALNQAAADLENVAPAARSPIRIARAPRSVGVLAMAGTFANDRLAAGKYPVQAGIVVRDRFQPTPQISKQLLDLFPSLRHAPLREINLGVRRKQIENRSAGCRHTPVVQRLEILQRDP